jgi:cyclic pyranopterin phosphate synthase
MRDLLGRPIKYLRLSVTDACNYRCGYCMPEGEPARAFPPLSAGELAEIARQAAALGVCKVRLTGGEPLIRRDIVEICRLIAAIDGVELLCMTTNGARLAGLAPQLADAGVRRINISIDSLRPERYRRITRLGRLWDALAGLDAALCAGFDQVKVNVVLIGGVNDDEIEDFVGLTRQRPIEVRFIELMPIGPCAAWPKARFVSGQTVLERCLELEHAGRSGVAQRYRKPGHQGTVGLIRPISDCFCARCDRIRVTGDGMLKACLHGCEEISLKGLAGDALRDAIARGILSKPAHHGLNGGASRSARCMHAIGG